jgi:glycosyltransferase involved in cell wall biosynthesis
LADNFSVLHLNAARTWRGGEQQTLYLAQGLAGAGIRQAVFGREGSDLMERCVRAGIEFAASRIGSELDISSARRIAGLARQRGYSILHAHTAHAHTLGLLAKLFAPELKLVVTRRVDFPIRGFSRLKYKTRLVDRFAAISQNVKKIMLQDGIPEEKISLIYSGTDTSRFKKLPDARPLLREFQAGKNEIITGTLGALVDHKDQRTLIRAFAALPPAGTKIQRQTMPAATLILAGDGDRREEYEEIARRELHTEPGERAGGRRIIFAGFRTDVPSLLALFDIYAMSSKEEGLGTSVLDAMAAGLPVVTTDGGGLGEMIDQGRGGLVSSPEDPRALSENLLKMILDSKLRQRAGAYNKRRVNDFSVKRMVEGYLELYSEIAAQ